MVASVSYLERSETTTNFALADPDRDDAWASPPGLKSWDLLSGDFVILKNSPDIIGIGSKNSYVWVALDDARSNIEPRAIKRL